jgi:hypothetical protein
MIKKWCVCRCCPKRTNIFLAENFKGDIPEIFHTNKTFNPNVDGIR